MKTVSNEMYSFVYGYDKERGSIVMDNDKYHKFMMMYELKLRAMIQAQMQKKENKNERIHFA